MNTILDQALQTIRHNPLQSAWMLTILGAIGTALWRIPILIWRWVQSLFVVHVTVVGTNVLYDWLLDWASEKSSMRSSRILIGTGGYSTNAVTMIGSTGKKTPQVQLAPGPGSHFFIYKGRPIWMFYSRTEAQGGTSGAIWREELHFRTFGRSSNNLQKLFEEAKDYALNKHEDMTTLFLPEKYNSSSWERVSRRKMRSLESVILPEEIHKLFIREIESFLSLNDWYRDMGIPHRQGYLLYGPPGTGKSSLVAALAGHFRMDLYILSLSSDTMTDSDLLKLLSSLEGQKMIVMLEDVDAVFVDRASAIKNGVTFSGLLNALDGVAAQEGRILVMSTNHIERLDPALIRNGRIDHRIELTWATTYQIEKLFLRFFPDMLEKSVAFAEHFQGGEYSMAAIQGILLKNKNSADRTIEAAYFHTHTNYPLQK